MELKILEPEVIGSFKEKVGPLEDTADNRGKHYGLSDILCLTTIGLLRNENDFCNIERTLKMDEKAITEFLGIEAIPSDDTMRRRLEEVDPKALSRFLDDEDPDEEFIILDGKGLNASASTEKEGGVTPYILNAQNGVTKKCIGAVYVGSKESEKTKAIDLIKLIGRTNRTFTGDAALNTRPIRDLLHKTGNRYVFPLKGNNKTMERKAKALFDEAEEIDYFKKNRRFYFPENVKIHDTFGDGAYTTSTELESGHFREEYRKYSLLVLPPEFQKEFSDPNIKAIGKVVRKTKQLKPNVGRKTQQKQARRQNRRKKSKKKSRPLTSNKVRFVETEQIVYYNMNFVPKDVVEFARYVREEWSIENKLHYILDEVFREDRSTLRRKKLRLNMATLRRIVFNLLLSVGLTDEKAPKYKETPHTKRAFFAKNLAGVLALISGPMSEEEMVWLKTLIAEAFVEKIEQTLGAFAQQIIR